MLGLMYMLIRRVFPVRFEWRRMAHIVLVMSVLTVGGDLILPTSGASGLLLRAVVFLAIPVALLLTSFAHPQELGQVRLLVRRMRSYRVAGRGVT
jgi:hypothetical protein